MNEQILKELEEFKEEGELGSLDFHSSDWKKIDETFEQELRWVNIYTTVFKHVSGVLICVEHASSTGDGDSASEYEEEWAEVEAYEEVVTKYRRKSDE